MNAQLETKLLKKKRKAKRFETVRNILWRGLIVIVCGFFARMCWYNTNEAPTVVQYVVCLVFTLVAICVVCDWVLERFPPEMDK